MLLLLLLLLELLLLLLLELLRLVLLLLLLLLRVNTTRLRRTENCRLSDDATRRSSGTSCSRSRRHSHNGSSRRWCAGGG